jgi:WD40 repeat protein
VSQEAAPSSLSERIRPVAAGGPVVAAHFLKGTGIFVLGEEALVLAPPEGGERRVAVHGGGILASAADRNVVVTGGDDGQVVLTSMAGETRVLATDPKRRWIDRVAIGPDQAVAWAAGKTAVVAAARIGERSIELPSSIGGLAFAPKGLRLAVAHYNGVSLWFPNAAAEPERLEWKGSHLGVGFSPDGRFVVTTMQEASLHGWRLADRTNLRMQGYPGRVRSFAFTAGGRWLATSGVSELILWPFQGKDGPLGKQPKMLAATPKRIELVACHPAEEVVAVGCADGLVLLVRMADGGEILVRRPDGAPVTALTWDARGERLAFGCEDGSAGILELG